MRLLLIGFLSLAVVGITAEKTFGEDESSSLDLVIRAIDSSENDQVKSALLRGVLSGLSGRRNVTPPSNWSAARERLSVSAASEVRELSNELSQIFGDRAATRRSTVVG